MTTPSRIQDEQGEHINRFYRSLRTKPRYTFRDVFISQIDGAKFYLFALDGHAILYPVDADWFWGRNVKR